MKAPAVGGRRIFKNFLSLSAAQIVAMIAGALTTIVLARALGPESYGILGFGVAVVSYFTIAVNMGMDINAVRQISGGPGPTREIAGTVIILRLVLAGLLFGFLSLMVSALDPADEVGTVLVIQGIGLFAVALGVDFVYQGLQRMGILAIRQIAASLLGLGAVVLLITSPEDILRAASIPVVVNFLMVFALLVHVFRKGDGVTLAIDRRDIPGFLRRSAPLAAMAALITVYINLDIVILQFLRPQEEVGLYVAASRVVILASLFSNMLHASFLPALTAVRHDDGQRMEMARHFASAVMFLGAPIAVFGVLFSGPIVEVLFGPAFSGAVTAFAILMVHVAVVHLTAVHGTPALAWNCDRPYLWILVAGAGLNVVLNFLLIPRFGIEGAAAATLAAQVVVWLGLVAILRRRFGIDHAAISMRACGAAVISGVPIFIVLWFYPAPPLATLILGAIAYSVTYIVVASLTGVVDLKKVAALFRP